MSGRRVKWFAKCVRENQPPVQKRRRAAAVQNAGANFDDARKARSVLECASPLALSNGAGKPSLFHRPAGTNDFIRPATSPESFRGWLISGGQLCEFTEGHYTTRGRRVKWFAKSVKRKCYCAFSTTSISMGMFVGINSRPAASSSRFKAASFCCGSCHWNVKS